MANRGYSAQAHDMFKKAMPVMASALALLVFGGMVGIGYLVTLMGSSPPAPLSWTPRFFTHHWFYMVMGFTLALISAELLVLLSAEWSKRAAPRGLIMAFVATVWASAFAYTLASKGLGLLLSALATGLVLLHVKRSLLTRSWIGLPPTHYNHLLATTLLLTLILTLAHALDQLGLVDPLPLNLALASMVLPVGAIIAVESRDIPLLMGIPPTRALAEKREQIRTRAVTGYALSVGGILLLSYTGSPASLALGGLLVLLGGVIAASSVGLLGLLEKTSAGVPKGLKGHSRLHIMLSFAWFLAAGLIAMAWGLGAEMPLAEDAIVHSLALGFMFNVIFGVDAILLYGHAGIPINRVPPPTPIPTLLLNASLLLRLAYDLAGAQLFGLVLASGPLAGLAILYFYARNMRHIRRLLKTTKTPG